MQIFFWCFSKFSKIAINFKENFENFHLQRPHQTENVCLFCSFSKFLKISTFNVPINSDS
eukprot:UN22303